MSILQSCRYTIEEVFPKTFRKERLDYEGILDVTATLEECPIGFVGSPTDWSDIRHQKLSNLIC